MNKFKVGDRVTVASDKKEASHCGYMFNGQSGRVVGCPIQPWKYYNLELDSGACYAFYPEELLPEDRITAAAQNIGWTVNWMEEPFQSPQPQQTKTQEETMRYVVLYKNLAQQGQACISGHFATEAEAKLVAEQNVAQQRANLQVKQYFTVAIIDMQTGKLVGSVTDAPPPVNWEV